jgi:hypothetical protein
MLADRFAASRGAPIWIGGDEVYCIYRRLLAHGDELIVRRRSARAEPVSGLRLKLRNGQFAVGERRFAEVVLWADTSPAEVALGCDAGGGEAELAMWNCWRSSGGVVQAWLGDAGMVVEEPTDDDAPTTLRCSAGIGAFDPSGLVVDLVIRRT